MIHSGMLLHAINTTSKIEAKKLVVAELKVIQEKSLVESDFHKAIWKKASAINIVPPMAEFRELMQKWI